MRLGRFLLLAVAALFLGAYVLFFELRVPVPSPQEKMPRILDFDPAKVTGIKIRFSDGRTLSLSGKGGEWRLEERLETPFTPFQMARRAMGVFEYGWVEILKKDGGSIDHFGFDRPEVSMTLTISGGNGDVERTLFLGADNPTHADCYARLNGDDRIFLVGVLYKDDLKQLITMRK